MEAGVCPGLPLPSTFVSAPFWVARLEPNAGAASKVGSKHGFRFIDVRDAVQCRHGLRATRNFDPARGVRFILNMRIDGRAAVVVLRAVRNDVDVYSLVTAFEP